MILQFCPVLCKGCYGPVANAQQHKRGLRETQVCRYPCSKEKEKEVFFSVLFFVDVFEVFGFLRFFSFLFLSFFIFLGFQCFYFSYVLGF